MQISCESLSPMKRGNAIAILHSSSTNSTHFQGHTNPSASIFTKNKILRGRMEIQVVASG